MGYLWRRFLLFILIPVLIGTFPGCSQAPNSSESWYSKAGWTAESYFDDPRVIELCKTIESRDIAEIEKLIADGANVNAKGKDGMTPLMWAYPEQNLEAFSLLLRHGADPNVSISSDLKTRGTLVVGDTVTTVAARTGFLYLKLVLDHGGDTGLRNRRGESLLHVVVRGGGSEKKECIKLLLDREVDVNDVGTQSDLTPAMAAVVRGGQYDLALFLLQSGADYKKYGNSHNQRLIHFVLANSGRHPEEKLKEDYNKLLSFLTERGESVEAAQKDLDRWAAQPTWDPSAMKRLREQEVAEGKAREGGGNN